MRTYLEQAWRLDDEIKSKIEQLDVLNALAAHTTSALSGMPHAAGHEGSKLEDIIVKIVDLQEKKMQLADSILSTDSVSLASLGRDELLALLK